MKYLLKNAHLIIDGTKEYLNGALLINDERIEEVYPQSNKLDDISNEYKTIDLNGSIVMPGFFDTHSHGVTGINYDKANIDDFDYASKQLIQTGTTSFITSLSYHLSKEEFLTQLKCLDKFESAGSRFMGIHLEGPFLSEKHKGAGNGENLIKVDLDLINEFINTTNKIKQMTIAIELEGTDKIVEQLKKNNIKVMVGHSDALEKDLNKNVDGFTHLFNAMRGLHHRDSTLINAAFTNNYYCEIIGDGHHINKDVLKLIINNINRNKIILISDSSPALGLEDGEYDFLSSKCIKENGTFKNETGNLAGSVASINDEIKILKSLGADYTDLLLYSSLNAYCFYNLDKQFGSLVKGKYSDIVIMDDDLNIKNVLIRGKLLYE